MIIYRVDRTRDVPVRVIDIDNNGNTGDAGAIWTPGKVFSDPVNQIYVCVLSETADGYNVTAAQDVVPACASAPTATPTKTSNATNTRTRTPTRTTTTTRTLTPTATPPPASDWIFCAAENKTCTLPGARLVRFGANGFYKFKTLSASFVCKATTFGGDPLPGVAKRCEYNSNPNAPTPTRTATTNAPNACLEKPAAPLLLQPKNGALIRKGQATLKWESTACADNYTVIIIDTATNKRIERKTGVTGLEYTTQKLKPGYSYRWQIVSVNVHGHSSSKLRELTTQ